MIRALVASALLGSSAALELTETRKYGLGASIPEFISNLGKELGCPDPSMSMTNFIDRCLIKAETAGKSHCKKLKPDWDKLMDEFNGSPGSLVADVDCTAEGQSLCEKHEVKGYPTIKYGDPGDLKDYSGGRDFNALKKFAEENLGPTCGPANLELCSEEVKKKIEGYM
ncbi:Protein disulfide-isomerase-like protein EhSep2, partial [Durusdinium trenchii]